MANSKVCEIRCNTRSTQHITKVIITNDNYDRISLIANITLKSIQEVTAELLSFALANCVITDSSGKAIDILGVNKEEER